MSVVTKFGYLGDIKGTALNKGRARSWIEKNVGELASYGFTPNCRVDVVIGDHAIQITVNPEGKRKPTVRKGKMIFDICYPVEKRLAMFGDSPKLQVWIGRGVIGIAAANIPATLGDL